MGELSKNGLAPYRSHDVTLRLIGAADLPATLAWRNRDDARVWFKSSAPLTPAQHEGWFKAYSSREDDYLFIVEADGVVVGQASVYGIEAERKSAEIGRFLVAPEHRGQGYIDRACGALIDFCRERLGLEYLFLEVFDHNQRALRVYRHHGFTPEASHDGLTRMGLRLV